ncbi:hypothetical protein ACN47E_000303 [Coniothyrium glycines]
MSMNAYSPKSSPVPRVARSPRSPPLPQFEEPPEDDYHDEPQVNDAPHEDDIPYPEPSSEQLLLPPPNFRPFFTLIEDATSGEHYHPYVHYVFADDDPVIMTAASMRGLGLDDTRYLPQEVVEGEERQSGPEDIEGGEDDLPVESPLPPPIPGVKEHYLVIDISADGRSIVDAQSLSSEWQVTKTDVRTAPSFDESSPDQGYMLRVHGIEIQRKNKGKGKGSAQQDKFSEAREKNQGDIFGAMDGLVQGIEESLSIAGCISGEDTTRIHEIVLTDATTQNQGSQQQ